MRRSPLPGPLPSVRSLPLKNGWMPRSATGLWDVNSIGQVKADGHTYLVAVLSAGQPTKETGIERVESVAKAAVRVLDEAR